MKQFKIILGLILLASVTTFAQSPRIKLNQITKDTVKGSVLISNPTDSGMVYSRDFYIAYGADTLLILYGDTIGGVGGGVNSIVVDTITLNGNGTTASPLSVDTATVISTIQGLVDSLANYVTINTAQTITGAKSFSANTNFDSGTLYVDATNNKVGIGTSSPNAKLSVESGDLNNFGLDVNGYGVMTFLDLKRGIMRMFDPNVGNGATLIGGFGTSQWAASDGAYDPYFFADDGNSLKFGTVVSGVANQRMIIANNGNVGIGTSSPSEKLDVNGKVKIQDLTGTGGNAVYENGGVLGVASDARFKTYVGDIVNGIELINQLKPKYFIDNRNSSFQQLGFYAQEVKSVINEASYPIGNTDYLGINDRAILATSVKAIQEQQAIIETQQTEINQLKTLITDLTNRLIILENK